MDEWLVERAGFSRVHQFIINTAIIEFMMASCETDEQEQTKNRTLTVRKDDKPSPELWQEGGRGEVLLQLSPERWRRNDLVEKKPQLIKTLNIRSIVTCECSCVQ